MTHSPSEVVQKLLIDRGLATDPDASPIGAWPVYASGEPASPDEVLVVYDTQGSDQGRAMPTGEVLGAYGIQLLIRSRDHNRGWAKGDGIQVDLAEEVYDSVVHVAQRLSVAAADYLVKSFVGIGDVLALGKDTPNSKRSLFSLNVLVHIEEL